MTSVIRNTFYESLGATHGIDDFDVNEPNTMVVAIFTFKTGMICLHVILLDTPILEVPNWLGFTNWVLATGGGRAINMVKFQTEDR